MQHCHNLMPLCMHNAVNPTRSPDPPKTETRRAQVTRWSRDWRPQAPPPEKFHSTPVFVERQRQTSRHLQQALQCGFFFFIFFVARCSGTEWLRLISLYSYSIISTPWLASGGLFTPSLTVSCALTNLDSCTPCSSPAHQCIQFMTNPVALHSRTLSLSS